jgi:hypothetical protein
METCERPILSFIGAHLQIGLHKMRDYCCMECLKSPIIPADHHLWIDQNSFAHKIIVEGKENVSKLLRAQQSIKMYCIL